MIIANFMDSSLLDLRRKGVFDTVGETYNPGRAYERVIHFTPHVQDLETSDALLEHRIEVRVHGVSAIQPLKFVRALARTWHAFGRDHVDLVRGRLPYVGSLIGGLAARLRGLPFVVSLGGDNRIPQESDGYLYHSRTISHALENAVLRLATRIIVPNRYTATYVERVIGAKAARKRCAVIGWMSRPVPPAGAGDDETLAALGIEPDRALVPIIGFVNRYKYSHVLFEVLAQGTFVGADGKPVLFCFAGDGPLRAEGEQRFAYRGDIIFAGWQQKPVIQAMLRRAKAVVIPMSGFVLLEAASIGKPVITSSVEWHGELVADGRSGLLVDPQDRAAWRAAIARMLADPAEAVAMGGELKAAYWQHFSPEACTAAEHRLYEDLTGKRVAS